MMPQVGIQTLALLTLFSNIAVVIYLLVLVGSRMGLIKKKTPKFLNVFSGKEVLLSLIVALTATLGSLYFSEVAGFEPCKLCWLQRIFMYPLVIILGTAYLRKLKDAWNYVLPLSITGGLIAAYHYYFQVTGNPLIPCSTVGFSISCSERFFTYFGYITIPWMSLSAFVLVTIGMLLLKYKKS